MEKIGVAVIGSVGVPANYGGFETLVENLLEDERIVYTVYCSRFSYEHRPKEYKSASLKYISLPANGILSILYDIVSLIDAIRGRNSIVLVLGTPSSIIFPILKHASNVSVVCNVDGREHRRQKWGWLARKFLHLTERLAVQSASLVVADNRSIGDQLLEEYGHHATYIPYGGDHALAGTDAPGEPARYALSICRIEAENNVELILDAFSESGDTLKFVGNWDATSYGRKLRTRYSHYDNLDLIDPVYDLKALAKLRAGCALYVHGHSAGGTNPSLVEIMHFGVTTLCFDCSYNRSTTHHRALFFKSKSELRNLLTKVQNRDDSTMGQALRQIAREEFTWHSVREAYYKLFVALTRND